MNSGTLNPSLMAGAARPVSGSCGVLPAMTFGTSPAGRAARVRISAIAAIPAAGHEWTQVWHLDAIKATKPAYPVAHTDRLIPRPLERSP